MAIFRILPIGDISLEPTGDGKVRPFLVTGVDFVKIKISQRLRFWLGEWYRDQRLGVPYRQSVFVQNPDVEIIRSLFRKVILSVQEVASVDALLVSYTRTTRTLAVAFRATLVEGGVLLVRQPDPAFIIQLQRAA